MGRSRRGRGFTLIEVMVALLILATALGAVITAGAQYAQYASYLRDQTFAYAVARNQLVELHLQETWPSTGRSDGRVEMGGREWEWVTEVQETQDEDIRRADVRVRPIEYAEDEHIASLSGFLTEPEQASAPQSQIESAATGPAETPPQPATNEPVPAQPEPQEPAPEEIGQP